MDYKKNILPLGVQDFLPEECYNKNRLERRFENLYKSWGYFRVETPGFEYLDTFAVGSDISNIFKFSDYDGNLLALRADPTLQISRMAANNGLFGVTRYYYILNSYEYWGQRVSAGRSREYSQAGVELLGSDSVDADVEIVALAVATLKETEIPEFLVEISTAGFFKGLIEGLNLTDEQTNQIGICLNKKDVGGLQKLLSDYNISGKKAEDILMAPTLFGDEEVLDEAAKMSIGADGKRAIQRLKRLAAKLKATNIINYCMFDLGLVPELDYYSGIVIKGISPSLGQPLLSGGRYNYLSRNFGADTPAIGFSVGTKRVLSARKNIGKRFNLSPCDYAYLVADEESESIALSEVQNLRAQGKSVVRALCDNLTEAKEFCQANGIPSLIVFTGGKKEVII